MLQLNTIREEKDRVLAGLKKRNFKELGLIDEIIALDEKRRSTQLALDESLAKSNTLSKEIGSLFKSGETEKANALKAETATLKDTIKTLTDTLNGTVESLNELLYRVPNIPNDLVPEGTSEADNVVVFEAGEIPNLGKDALPHWELAKKYDLIDFELGVKLTGAGFPVYKGKGAKLPRAQLPDKEGQMYHVGVDNLYLIPTAEVPVTNIFRDVLLNESDLPICCTAYTPCFRREAGSYGAHVRGLNRLHQFDKVEIVRIEHPDHSYKALEGMIEHVKGILNELKLPYHILRLCGGDLGFTSAITYDFEVYSTAQEKWLEISSVSNFETFQANRLKLRFKDSEGKNRLVHTLNGSSLALPRVLAGILENYQTPEGIVVPEVLRKYTGFDIIS